MRRYLLAADGSAAAGAAARELGTRLRGERDVRVTVLHVCPPVREYDGHTVDYASGEILLSRRYAEMCEPVFAAARAALGLPPEEVECVIRLGRPAEDIAREWREGGYEELTLGRSSSRGRVRRELEALLAHPDRIGWRSCSSRRFDSRAGSPTGHATCPCPAPRSASGEGRPVGGPVAPPDRPNASAKRVRRSPRHGSAAAHRITAAV